MAIKFSQFSESTTTSQVDFIVGYDGNQNVRISPSNFLAVLGDYLPLTGGTLTGNLTAPAFIKTGGTSSEFLKADGTVDTNTYLTTTTGDARYVELTGDTMTGNLTITKSSPVFELNSNSIYPYGRIEFAGSTFQAYEILAQSNPGINSLALRSAPAGTMQDSFVVSSQSGSGYNYSAVPLRIGANAAANELDDYEEGTFDFQFRIASTSYDFNTTNFGSNFWNYSRYVKVGRKVTCFFDIKFSSNPWGSFASTDAIYILGLPFTLQSGSSTTPGGVGGTYNFASNPTLSSSADAAESGAVSGRFYHPTGGFVYLTKNYYNVGYYTAWYTGSITKADWPGNDPGSSQYLKGMLTYYTTD